MKQLPLIFFINAASAIFHTNDCHTVFLSQRYHHFRPLIAKLDSITNQVTDYRLTISISARTATSATGISCTILIFFKPATIVKISLTPSTTSTILIS